jgi:hypothetical protein
MNSFLAYFFRWKKKHLLPFFFEKNDHSAFFPIEKKPKNQYSFCSSWTKSSMVWQISTMKLKQIKKKVNFFTFFFIYSNK